MMRLAARRNYRGGVRPVRSLMSSSSSRPPLRLSGATGNLLSRSNSTSSNNKKNVFPSVYETIRDWFFPSPQPSAKPPTKEGEFPSLTPEEIDKYIKKRQNGEIAFRGVNAKDAQKSPRAPAHQDISDEEFAQLPRNKYISKEEAEKHVRNKGVDSELLSLTTNVGMANDIANPPDKNKYVDPAQGVVQIIDIQGLHHRAGDKGQSEIVTKYGVERGRVLRTMSHARAKEFEKAWLATPEAQSRLKALEELKAKRNLLSNNFSRY